VRQGEIGEVQIRPREPGIILREYWRRPEATLEAYRNLWFHTGDRARMDEDGFLFSVDRLKDSIRRRGENISSYELESVIGAFESVVECAAYGVPSELGEDDVMVAIVADPDRTVDIDRLIAYCEDQLARFAVPRYVRLMDRLPKNSSQPETIDRGPRAGARPGSPAGASPQTRPGPLGSPRSA
jgi:crotonobetaine/carnitine-CoA ligase